MSAMTGKAGLAVALSAVLALGPFFSVTAGPAAGWEQSVAVETGGSASFPLAASEGDYVVGRLESPNHPFDLELLGADGAPLRRLLKDNTGAGRFHFVVPEGAGALRASNRGAAAFEVRLVIETVVPAAEQIDRFDPVPDLISPAMAALVGEIAAGNVQAIEAFWAARAAEGTPMIEPATEAGQSIVTFLWRGARKNVRLWGAPTSDHVWMQRLEGSDIWFASFRVPDSARLTYGFAPDVPQFDGTARENRVALLATLQADPLNRAPVFPDAPDRWAQRSQLVMPQAPEQPGMEGALPAARGSITRMQFASELLGNARNVDLYLPAGFDPQSPDTVVLFLFDGPAYQTARAPVPAILDRLIAAGRLPPVVAVLIDPMDNRARGRELPCNADFADAIADELLPQVEARLGLTAEPERTVVAGSSYGGLASAWLVHRRPDRFGNAVVLSGSFWWAPEGYAGQGTPYMSSLWMEQAPPGVRLWMSAGRYEIGRRPGDVSILETTRHLRDVLRLSGVEARYREYVGGHDYLIWRGALAEGLLSLFGAE